MKKKYGNFTTENYLNKCAKAIEKFKLRSI